MDPEHRLQENGRTVVPLDNINNRIIVYKGGNFTPKNNIKIFVTESILIVNSHDVSLRFFRFLKEVVCFFLFKFLVYFIYYSKL